MKGTKLFIEERRALVDDESGAHGYYTITDDETREDSYTFEIECEKRFFDPLSKMVKEIIESAYSLDSVHVSLELHKELEIENV